MGKGHPLAKRPNVALAEIEDQRLIIRETGSYTRLLFEQELRRQIIVSQQVLEISSSEGLLEAVALGLGVGIIQAGELTLDNRIQLLTTIEHALQQFRATIKRYYRQCIIVESKADASIVTEADRTVESQIHQIISQRHPNHGIIGEEYGSNQNLAAYMWVIDPIDGTKSFISSMPTFGTLIDITHHKRPKLGVIDMPILNRC